MPLHLPRVEKQKARKRQKCIHSCEKSEGERARISRQPVSTFGGHDFRGVINAYTNFEEDVQ